MSAGTRTVMHHSPVINTYQCAYSNGTAHMMIFQALGFLLKLFAIIHGLFDCTGQVALPQCYISSVTVKRM